MHELTDLPQKLDPRKAEAGLRAQRPHPRRGDEQPRRGGARAARAGSSPRASRSRTRPEGARVKDEEAPLWDDAPEPCQRLDRSGPALPRGHGRPERTGSRGSCCATGSSTGRGRPTQATAAIADKGAQAAVPGGREGGGRSSRSSTSTTPPRRRSRRSSAAAPGIYNIVDDDPAADARLAPGIRRAAGCQEAQPCAGLAGPARGRLVMPALATELRGASNRKAQAGARLDARATRAGARASGGAGLRRPSARGAARLAQLRHAVRDRALRLVAELRRARARCRSCTPATTARRRAA